MKPFWQFSNLLDVNKIKQLSNNDILISSSNTLKIYSINSFQKVYKISEIKSPIISIFDIVEIEHQKQNEILLAISLSNFSIQIIKLMIRSNKANSKCNKIYRHKLVQEINFRMNIKIKNICINSFMENLIVGINNKVFYYKNNDKDKINFIKNEEYEIKQEIIIKGIVSIKIKEDNFIITIEENSSFLNNIFDLKIYFFENFELITYLKDLNLSPEKGIMSFMTYYNYDKNYLIVGDKHDKLLIIKIHDDFDIYEEICLSTKIKELSFNKFNKRENYEIKSICGLNNGTFVVCLYYNESLNEKNYIIKGRVNFKSKKFELIDINNNAHNNKTNFITASSMIKGNKKPEEYFFISGDHEGALKIWKI